MTPSDYNKLTNDLDLDQMPVCLLGMHRYFKHHEDNVHDWSVYDTDPKYRQETHWHIAAMKMYRQEEMQLNSLTAADLPSPLPITIENYFDIISNIDTQLLSDDLYALYCATKLVTLDTNDLRQCDDISYFLKYGDDYFSRLGSYLATRMPMLEEIKKALPVGNSI